MIMEVEKDEVKMKRITNYFSGYSIEEIKKVVDSLDNAEKELMYSIFGEALLREFAGEIILSKEERLLFRQACKDVNAILEKKNEMVINKTRKRNKNLYENFPEFSKAEIDEMLKRVPKDIIALLKRKYGEDYMTSSNDNITNQEYLKIKQTILPKLKKMLVDKSLPYEKKRRKVTKVNKPKSSIRDVDPIPYFKEGEVPRSTNRMSKALASDTSHEEVTSGELVPEEEKVVSFNGVPLSNEIRENGIDVTGERLKKDIFKYLFDVDPKGAMILGLRLGYYNGKNYSIRDIAKMFNMSEDETKKAITTYLDEYKAMLCFFVDQVSKQVISDDEVKLSFTLPSNN